MFLGFQNRKFGKRDRVEDPNFVSHKVLSDEYLREIYRDIVEEQLSLKTSKNLDSNVVVELGSAGGITKKISPEIYTTDVRIQDGVDFELNSDFSLPFLDTSVDCIIAKDVLHHISDPNAHFQEINRVLKVGGTVIYTEPNWNFVSRLVFTFFHPEVFNRNQVEWSFPSSDPMYSNQALPYIIFVRDLEIFEDLYPNFEVTIHPKRMNGLSFYSRVEL